MRETNYWIRIINEIQNDKKNWYKLDEESKVRFLAEKEKRLQLNWINTIYTKLVGTSKPIEEEGEIILDHNYDGIKELDNNLPPWWVWGFYATIVFSFIYFLTNFVIYC